MNIYDAAWFFREGSGFPPLARSITFDSPPPSPPPSPPLPLHFPSTVVEGSRGKGSSVLSSQLQISDSITYILSYRHSLHDFFPLSLIIYPLSLTMLVCHFSHCVSSSSFRLPLFFLFLFRDSRMPFFFAADRGKQQPAVCLMGRHNNFGRVKSSG